MAVILFLLTIPEYRPSNVARNIKHFAPSEPMAFYILVLVAVLRLIQLIQLKEVSVSAKALRF